MEKKEERYLNITLQNDNNDDKEIVVSFLGIWKKLKKYFIIWLVAAIVVALLTVTSSAIFSSDQHKSMTSLVSFTFDGIEEGLDPAGNKFDVNSLKNPSVIETALTELGYSLEELEIIRQGISIEGIIPKNAIDRITTYKSIYESNTTGSALNAAQAMLDVTYYPTQYKVKFNYAATTLGSSQAVEVLNKILESYRDYFFETYGYNKALGSAVSAVDYTTYDYAEAIDVFSTTLKTLENYVSHLAEEDTTRYRSSETGYTFADLSEAIKSIQSMDLDRISSYITVNNITKDKESLIDYYQYRIDAITREKTIASENLATISKSIEAYQKDTIMIFGNGNDNTNTQETQASKQYDILIDKKIKAQNDVSTTTQNINFYNQRIKALKENPVGSDAKKERVETDFNVLYEKVSNLINIVNQTADEYYTTVAFANAYNVLVPASVSSVTHSIQNVIEDSVKPLLVLEVLVFVLYICVVLVTAVAEQFKINNASVVPVSATAKEDKKEN